MEEVHFEKVFAWFSRKKYIAQFYSSNNWMVRKIKTKIIIILEDDFVLQSFKLVFLIDDWNS